MNTSKKVKQYTIIGGGTRGERYYFRNIITIANKGFVKKSDITYY
jgi:hypothetical protein